MGTIDFGKYFKMRKYGKKCINQTLTTDLVISRL